MKQKSVYHWLVVACCCAMMAVVFGISLNCSGIFYAPVAETLSVGRGDVALYITIMNLVTGFASPLVAKWIKKFPLRLWLICGGLMTVLSLALWSRVNALWQLYGLAVVHGIGNVMMGSVVLSMIINAWFNQRTGLAMGITFSFSGIAGALLSPIFQSIIDQSGWQTAHNYCAILAAILVLPGIIFLRLNPREKALEPYGGIGKNKTGVNNQTTTNNTPSSHNILVIAILVIGFITAFLTGLGQHVSGFATSVGLTAADGALFVTSVMVGNMASKLLFGILSDMTGAKKSFVFFITITVIGLAGLVMFKSFGMLLAASCMVGFTYSLSGVGLSQLAHSQMQPNEANQSYAWSQTAANIGSSIASAAIGYAYDLTGTYNLALSACLILGIISWLFVVFGFRGKMEQ